MNLKQLEESYDEDTYELNRLSIKITQITKKRERTRKQIERYKARNKAKKKQ